VYSAIDVALEKRQNEIINAQSTSYKTCFSYVDNTKM